MRILLVHNRYLQRGGEDAVFEAERDLLRDAGNEVFEHVLSNADTVRMNRVQLAVSAIWSRRSRRAIAQIVRDRSIDVVHFHNIQPLVSPAAFGAARRAGAAVVATLHNYRPVCPSATLFRDGQVCTECVGRKLALPAIQHRCYRSSRASSAVVAATNAVHRALGTWQRDVDAFLALTEFQRNLLSGVIPAEKTAIVPNFLVRSPWANLEGTRSGVLFVGRLSEEKGIRTLLAALRVLPAHVKIRVIGTGPLGNEVAAAAAADPRLIAVGLRNAEQVLDEMRKAAVLAVPSLWFEGMPMTIVEAFGCGLPVVASDLGGLPSIVEHGVNGELFRPGDPGALAAAIMRSVTDRRLLLARSRAARVTFESRFTADAHYRALCVVYSAAIRSRRDGSPLDLPAHLAMSAAASAAADPAISGLGVPDHSRA
ncbi:MAG: glycosyltransferase family 4 protein [Planctomycetota bacterium]